MNETSREYGAGLFALAEEYNIEDEIFEGISVLSDCFSDDYIHILVNPGIPKTERIGLIRELLEGKCHEYLVNYIMLMTERSRASAIKESFVEYEKLYLEKFAVVKVKAESAYPLNDSQKEKLEEKLKKLTGRRPILEYVIDPSLIGGMRLTYDNHSIDDSVQTKLKEIGAVLSDTTV